MINAFPPTQELTWIGVTFNSSSMTMSIDKIKIDEALTLATYWLVSKQSASTAEF